MELRIRFTIQLQFIYSICQTLYHWPGRGITPAFRTEESRKLALPVRCRTSAHRPRITGSRPRSKSRSCKTKIANIRKDFVPSRRTTLPRTTWSCWSRTCPSGICRSQGQTDMARRVAGSRSSTRTRETRKNPLPSGTEGSQETAETPAVLSNESPGLSPPAPAVDRSRRYPRILLILFLCTLPLVNPIVHGNGVGYYAYVRAPLIERKLDITYGSFRDQ